jgi:phage protein U
MFGSFGKIIFDTLTAPQGLSIKKETDYAEHARVGLKPRLQKTGEKLDEVTLSMHFHAEFCNPDDQVVQLNSIRKSGKAEPLVLGNGTLIGVFVVVSIDKTVLHTFPDGTTIECNVEVILREYVTSSVVKDKAKAAVESAFAVRSDAPLPSTPIQSIQANPAAVIMQSVQDAQLATAQSTAAIDKATVNPDYLSQASSTISNATQTVADSMNKAEAALSTAEALQTQAAALPGAIMQARDAALALASLMPITSIEDARLANEEMRTGMGSVRSASAPVATVSSFRGFM